MINSSHLLTMASTGKRSITWRAFSPSRSRFRIPHEKFQAARQTRDVGPWHDKAVHLVPDERTSAGRFYRNDRQAIAIASASALGNPSKSEQETDMEAVG